MGIRTEYLTLTAEPDQKEEQDILFVNEFEDRRYVFKQQDHTHPHARSTAFQGLTRYGEWIGLMEVTEERYPGQQPIYTIGIFVPVSEEGKETHIKQYSYGDPLSGWEEGFSRRLKGGLDETLDDLHEMGAVVTNLATLPPQVDTEATAHAFFQQIEQNTFLTPPIFRLDYRPDKEEV